MLHSAVNGLMPPQTREHILVARQISVPRPVVFLKKFNLVDYQEVVDLGELKARGAGSPPIHRRPIVDEACGQVQWR
jgi:translation elongation factor EF-Tu-like GTPase